ncbi:MAG: hypothetical protein AB8G18_19260 [Gammaproteobacteria bacterium]
MSNENLTEAEKRYLADLQKLPKTIKSRLWSWAVEVVPGICLFGYGLYSDSKFFLILGFLSILYFALWRMYSQFRGFKMFHSIYQKKLDGQTEQDD